jgi:hypothetical protein
VDDLSEFERIMSIGEKDNLDWMCKLYWHDPKYISMMENLYVQNLYEPTCEDKKSWWRRLWQKLTFQKS